MTEPNPAADFVFAPEKPWAAEMARLRPIPLSMGLAEAVKWGWPCYTDKGRNITLIHAFKDYCALLFMKGALLPDPEGLLVQQTENVQAARQVRFTSAGQIRAQEPAIRAFIQAAIAAEQAGLKVDMKLSRDLTFPQELIDAFDADPDFRTAFDALTPGRQRAWNLTFTQAKQPATRAARIAKAAPLIRAGKGPTD